MEPQDYKNEEDYKFFLIGTDSIVIEGKKFYYIEALDLENRYFFKVYGTKEDIEPYENLSCFSIIDSDCFKIGVKNGQLKYILNK